MQASHIHTIDASDKYLGRVRIWVTLTYFSRSEVKLFENGVNGYQEKEVMQPSHIHTVDASGEYRN